MGKSKPAPKKAEKKADKKASKKGSSSKHPLDALKKVATNVKKSTKVVTKKVGNKVVTVGKKIGKAVVKDAEWLALRPFKPLMELSLKKKGVNVSKNASMKTIGSLYYVNVVAKKSIHSLENITVYEHADDAENVAFQAASLVAKNSGVPGADISVSIIHKIIDYFKANQKKNKNSKVENKIDTLDVEIKEAESKGETDLVNKLKAEKKQLEGDIDPLTTDEKKVHGEIPGTVDKPLNQDEKDEADQTDKVQDAVSKVTPGTTDSKGKVHVKETKEPELDDDGNPKKHGIHRLFSW